MPERAPKARSTKNFVWLASYPKSGNTWLRLFLANYLFNTKTPLPINEVHRLGTGDSMEETYRKLAPPGADLRDPRKSVALRPKLLSRIAANGADVNFVKTHCLCTKAFGIDLIPANLTRSAIYIVRNPLDMVLSYARHYGLTTEAAAAAIGRSDHTVAGSGTVTQYLGTWSDHVHSWANCRAFPVLVLRFEEMKADPHASFKKVLEEIGVPVDPERLARAVRFADFEELQRQEQAGGFIEAPSQGVQFFHAGGVGLWRRELPANVVEKIRRDHGRVMRWLGYGDS